jgi:quercetin dioxygenase-like cupin family protein
VGATPPRVAGVEAEAPQAALLAAEEGDPVSDRAGRTIRALFEHPLIDVTWSRYGAGERGPEPHVHYEHVDAFYVVEGELTFGVGPDVAPVKAPAGTLVLVPPNVVHAFDNDGDATARWLNFHAPSTGFIAYLRGDGDRWDTHDPPEDGGRSAADAVVVTAAAGERFEREDRTVTILGDEPQLSALELDIDPGFEVPPHAHDDQVDSFFVLEGEVEFTVGDEVVRAGPGAWASAPPGARHGFRNTGPGRARVLNVHAPDAGFAGRVRGA